MMRAFAGILASGFVIFSLGFMAPPFQKEAAKSSSDQAKPDAEERPEDAKAIRELGVEFAKAYTKGDAAALATFFTEDGEVTSEDGGIVRGRKALVEHFAANFKEQPGEKLEIKSQTIRFFGPDFAREVGQSRTTPSSGGTPEVTRYTALLVRQNGRWLQASVHEYPEQDLTAHDRLKELEWMLGEWVDERDDGVVHTTCRWSEDKNFLLRDFVIRVGGQPTLSGSQRIGWNALTGQFQSWVFDPDGGHSEGSWNRSGKNQWTIRASGVLADGRTVVGTQILGYVNKNTIRWRSIDRAVDGEAVPDLDEITLVRTPPKAKAKVPTTPTKPK